MPASFRNTLWLAVLGGLAVGSLGCVHHVHQHPTRVVTQSPPPWAPAHGHRHVYQEQTLIFDLDLDCYTVVGHSDHFFHRDHYYRWRANRWERAERAVGPWRVVQLDRLPPGLRGWHLRNHAARQEQQRAERERQRAHELREHEQELARQQRAADLARKRAQEARKLERESAERARKLERQAERAEREREQRHQAERAEREREQRRVAERQRQERELALRERTSHEPEAVERPRVGLRKRKVNERKVVERKQKAKEQQPAEEDHDARRRAGKEQGVRSDASSLRADGGSPVR